MKTNLFALTLCFGLTLPLARARAQAPAPTSIHMYTEDATEPGTGYWTIITDTARPDYSLVRFYTPDHQQIYEERVEGLCLDPSQGTPKCRRTARMLSNALVEVERARTNSMVVNGLGIPRRMQRTFAAR